MNQTGILTFHDGLNYGAYLQTYSLSQVLSSLTSTDISVINYKNPRHVITDAFFGIKPYRLQDLPASLRKRKLFKKAQHHFTMTPRLYSHQQIKTASFDSIYVGSDEVWNAQNPLFGYDATYFDGTIAKKVCAYAASCGTCQPDSLTDSLRTKIKSGLRSFSNISVRDENTRRFVENLTGESPPIVLDPCFLSNIKGKGHPDKPYALLYASNISSDKVRTIAAIAHKRGLRLLSAGYSHSGVDENLVGLGPFEWLGLMEHAEIVFTTMFHGLVFSLKQGRPFVFLDTPYRKHKVNTLIEISECQNQIRQDGQDIETTLDSPWNPEAAQERLAPHIESSLDFLRNSLKL